MSAQNTTQTPASRAGEIRKQARILQGEDEVDREADQRSLRQIEELAEGLVQRFEAQEAED